MQQRIGELILVRLRDWAEKRARYRSLECIAPAQRNRRWLAGWQTDKLSVALLAAGKGLYRNNPACNTHVRICHKGTDMRRLVVPEVFMLIEADASTLI